MHIRHHLSALVLFSFSIYHHHKLETMPLIIPYTTEKFDLFTSLRYDPKLLTAPFNAPLVSRDGTLTPSPYMLFPYHLDRLRVAARAFGWERASETIEAPDAAERLREACDKAVSAYEGDSQTGVGLRVRLSEAGELNVEAHYAHPLTRDPLDAARWNPTTDPDSIPAPPLFTVYLDSEATPPSAFTSYKTTSREHYNTARARFGIHDRRELREVILYNGDGDVMEASVGNVAIWRDGWVMSFDEAGGLPGTMKRYMLEQGLVREGKVRKEDIRVGEYVLLSNGWVGTVLGRIMDGAAESGAE